MIPNDPWSPSSNTNPSLLPLMLSNSLSTKLDNVVLDRPKREKIPNKKYM